MKQVEVALKVRASLGECPRWDELDQKLYWVDINECQLHRFDPETGKDEFLQFDEEIGCFSLRRRGGFLLAMRSGFYTLEGWNTALSFIADPEVGMEKNRFNDGRADAFVYDLPFNTAGVRYGEVFLANEQQQSAYNFEAADVATCTCPPGTVDPWTTNSGHTATPGIWSASPTSAWAAK